MTLADMLAAHGDAALEALASKGLVRRAKKDTGTVDSRGDETAIVTTDGQTVEIGPDGPARANCTCPASGICRHILTAVILLRDVDGETEAVPAGPTAREEIAALSEDALRKFAGADWNAALALAYDSGGATLTEEGATCHVTLQGAAAPVSFIAGQGLKGAAFKGAKTRKRLMIVASALVIRAQGGATLPEVAEAEAQMGIAPEFLDAVAAAIEMAVPAILVGAAEVAQDRLFDLAISARAAAAPRLTGELRALARQAELARKHHVDFRRESFIADAARLYALTLALRQAPDDPALTGVLRRDYAPGEPLSLAMLGAVRWGSAPGARGLTVYGVTGEGGWHSVTNARGAGMDPGFDSRAAYSAPLWGAGTVGSAMGRVLYLPAPRIAEGGQLALRQEALAENTGTVESALIGAVAHRSRAALLADLEARLGAGLRQAAQAPALIAPARPGALGFDDMAQVFRVPVEMADGSVIALSFPAGNRWVPSALLDRARQIRAVLVEAMVRDGALVYWPVSIVVEEGAGLKVLNIQFDALSLKKNKRATPARWSAPVLEGNGPLSRLGEAALSFACDAASGSPSPSLDPVIVEAEGMGLSAIADAGRTLAGARDVAAALRLAYLADQVTRIALFRG